MTEQQKKFADEFIKRRCRHGSQQEAAIAAGYSEKTAKAIACNLMKREDIQQYIKERKEKLADDLREELLFDALEAREVMNNILNSECAENRDKLTAARDFLDRAGFKSAERVEVSTEEKSLNKLGSILEQLKK